MNAATAADLRRDITVEEVIAEFEQVLADLGYRGVIPPTADEVMSAFLASKYSRHVCS